jgi:hypothetical protein
MRAAIVGALALALMTVGGAASARELPAHGFTVADVVAWLQDRGYKAEVISDSDGTEHVESGSNGVKFGVYMFDCTEHRCGSIQFSAGFSTNGKFDTKQMNVWNHDTRWARGYFDRVGDPWVEYDVDLAPGGTYELLNDEFKTWTEILDRFVKQYDLG